MTNLSNRTKKYAQNLNYQGHRHPVIKAMLTIFEILSDYESRTKDGEDADRFLSTLGFNKNDRESLTRKSSRAFWGQGHFTNDDTPELFSLIGVTNENAKVFNGYNIVWEVFSSKGSNTGEIFDNLYGISKEGRKLLTQMSGLFENAITKLYYRYFEVR